MSGLKETPPTPYNGKETPIVIAGKPQIKNPSPFEVFNACANDLTGKDKLAKATQYLLRFLSDCNSIHGLGNPRVLAKFNADTLNSKIEIPSVIDTDSNVRTSKIPFIFNMFIKLSQLSQLTSKSSLKRGLLLLLSSLTKKLSLLLNGLNIYRRVLRMGTVPFRIWRFVNHIRHSMKILLDRSTLESTAIKVEKVIQYWTTKEMFSQIINFWYALSDEILLLYRFNILLTRKEGGSKLSDSLFVWAEDHELYSWMALILNGLYNDWNKWLILKDKESRIILNQKVKARTMKIVGDLKRKNNIVDSIDEDLIEFEQNYKDQLAEIRHELTTVYINSIRLTCDMIFDAKYILHWNMYKPLHTSLGFFSGTLGLINSWRSQREKLKNNS